MIRFRQIAVRLSVAGIVTSLPLLLLLLIVMQPLAACSASLPLRRLTPGLASYTFNSGMTTAQELLINDTETFELTWRQIHARRRPQPELPAIDFETNSVIIVAAGQQSSGGVEIRIDLVYQDGSNVIIDATTIKPGDTCVVSTGLTQPVDIAVVPKIEGPHEFRVSSHIRDCK
jgi:PrcB C-terminal